MTDFVPKIKDVPISSCAFVFLSLCLAFSCEKSTISRLSLHLYLTRLFSMHIFCSLSYYSELSLSIYHNIGSRYCILYNVYLLTEIGIVF